MEKNNYAKPFLVVEEFVPQEYCLICPEEEVIIGWKATGYITHDFYCDYSGDGRWTRNHRPDENIDVISSTPRWANSSYNDYITGNPPAQFTAYKCYESYGFYPYNYRDPISPIYKYTTGGKDYYFTGITNITKKEKHRS